jgi:hypothetical protein
MLWFLALACIKVGDTADTQATDTPLEPLGCADTPVETTVATGTWILSIDEALFNHCENQAGKGLHIHVGEDQRVDFDSSADPEITAVSDPGTESAMTFTGVQEGSNFAVEGNVLVEQGTCVWGINAVMRGEMTGPDSFCYQMDAQAYVHEEISPDACALIQGETENHTFPVLPCDQAWIGVGALTDL